MYLLLLLLSLFTSPVFAIPTTPTGDFIDNHDGTVTHKTTGLIWMRCAMGETWTGFGCTGTANNYTYAAAKKLTRRFAGSRDWRLPNIAELQTIVERDNSNPAMNLQVFNDQFSYEYWSSSSAGFVNKSENAWYVNFYNGYVGDSNRLNQLGVRLVRSGQSMSIGETTPTTEFIDNVDGTATHKRTGLMWQRCVVGQTWTGATCSGNVGIYTFDAAQDLTSNLAGYNDWRVPSANELASIVNYDNRDSSINSAINLDVFPKISKAWVWSSSAYESNSNYAWSVGFDKGYVDGSYRSDGLAVRLVRTSSPFDSASSKADLSIALTASAYQVLINQSLSYTATVKNNGKDTAKVVNVVFYLPLNHVALGSLPTNCLANSAIIQCNLGDLAVGVSATRTLSISYTQHGGSSVAALALTDSIDDDGDNNLSHVLTAILP